MYTLVFVLFAVFCHEPAVLLWEYVFLIGFHWKAIWRVSLNAQVRFPVPLKEILLVAAWVKATFGVSFMQNM